MALILPRLETKGIVIMKRILAFAMALLLASAPAALAEAEGEPTLKAIEACFLMTRDQLAEALGPDFELVQAGPEGVCDGYYYKNLGLVFAFYPDEDELDSISCETGFQIRGVGAGSLFSEVIEALGDAQVMETWIETPYNKAFMVQYRWGDIHYSFISFDEGGPVDLFWIYRAP